MAGPEGSGGVPADPLECPRCARRYAAGERFCDDCGMPLVLGGSGEAADSETHERARKIRPELTRGPLVRVAAARNQSEAELIQGMLLEEGVPSILRRSAGFDVPDFLAAGPRDILVPESGVEVARDALINAEIEPAKPPAPPGGGHIARLAAALTGGAAVAALIAWALIHAAR